MLAFKAKIASAENNKNSKLLRKLGNNEAYQLAMYTLDQYRGTSVACRYTPPSHLTNSEFRADLVRMVETAIADVVLQHPVLQVGIIDAESKNPTWVTLQRLDLHEHITWRFLNASDNFEEISKEVTASEIDGVFPELESRPGWRIVVLCQVGTNLLEINFTWNHPHADGMSGKIFQEDLYQRLNKPNRQEDKKQESIGSSIIMLPAAPQLPPPIEEISKLPLNLSFIAKMAWEEFGPASLAWTRTSLARWAPFRMSPYQTQFRAFDIKNDSLSKILIACRREKSTLTSLLHGLAMVSLAAQLDEKIAPAFESGTTVDMRRFIPSNHPSYPWLIPKRTMGNYVTVMSHEFDKMLVSQICDQLWAADDQNPLLPPKLLLQVWKISARVRGDIEHKISTGLKNDPVGAMKFVGDWRQAMSDAAKRPRQYSWWVTGVGVLDGKPKFQNEASSAADNIAGENTWAVHRAQFALSTESTAAAFMISPMTAKGERLSVGVSWQDCICDVQMGERVAADLQRWLGQIADES
ncbi:hypothetical protein SBOR_4865 [Sclerotinia borealis F-4128]|uniref:Alcohol acetyltransferase n=1 Tax=Sclerotinia borealis (strain F-4128) TaxID=1432307 RepID=W9CFR8_SCLBF|nr:hypothetical protein SBOR_4865 [Sclerotinia borealis F-4128]